MRQAIRPSRRGPFGLSVTLLTACLVTSIADAQPVKFSNGGVKIGVLTDLSGIYSDLAGAGSVLAARMALAFMARKKAGVSAPVLLGWGRPSDANSPPQSASFGADMHPAAVFG